MLGLFTYAAWSIPDLATIADPLWKLTSDKVEFVWTEVHTKALERIKKAVVKHGCAYFNDKWDTEVHTDASAEGLCAVLGQVDPDNPENKKIVTNISRSLTDVERRYSQVEKEALAVVWAFERLQLYLLGKHFKCFTDNRAVQIIFSNPNSKLPALIERWALRIMNFNASFIHKAGKTNIADYSLRHPIEGPGEVDYEGLSDENYIAFVSEHALPKATTREQMIAATKSDEQLQAVIKRIEQRSLSVQEQSLVKEFDGIQQELCTTSDGLVLRGTRLVVPADLKSTVLSIAHEGHLGRTKTKALMRSKVWFKGMDRMVEELVENCFMCKLNTIRSEHEPLKPTVMPSKAWDQLAMDFFGPLPNKNELMVVRDEMSRFPLVEEVKKTAAEHVCPALDKIFSLLGIPSQLKTDNGPPFNGHKFNNFCTHMGIKHRKVTPEHPEANGGAERFMPSLAKVVRVALEEKRD
jgi:hypothetical protein